MTTSFDGYGGENAGEEGTNNYDENFGEGNVCSENLHFDRSSQSQAMTANPLYPSKSAKECLPNERPAK